MAHLILEAKWFKLPSNKINCLRLKAVQLNVSLISFVSTVCLIDYSCSVKQKLMQKEYFILLRGVVVFPCPTKSYLDNLDSILLLWGFSLRGLADNTVSNRCKCLLTAWGPTVASTQKQMKDSLMTQEIAKVPSMQVYLQQSIVFKQTELSQRLRHAKWKLREKCAWLDFYTVGSLA